MAIAFRAAGTGNINGTALVVTAPAGLADGDVMLAVIGGRGSSLTCTPPAGWTSVITQIRSTVGKLFIFSKVASGESGSYTFTLNVSSQHSGGILAFTGVNTTTPVNVSAGAQDGTSVTAHVAPDITTTVDGCMILRAAMEAVSGVNSSYTWPAPATERFDVTGTDGTVRQVTSAATEPQTTAGATGTRTGTSAQATSYASVSVALAPQPVNPPINTVAPAITGTLTSGSTLTVSNGTWSNSPTGYTYQWKRDGVNISGATASTYVVTVGDRGTTLTCTVTATNADGSASATSAGAVIPAVAVVATPFRDFHTVALAAAPWSRYFRHNGVGFTSTNYNETDAVSGSYLAQILSPDLSGSFFGLASGRGILLGQAAQPDSIVFKGIMGVAPNATITDLTQKSFTFMGAAFYPNLSVPRQILAYGDGTQLTTTGRYLNLWVGTDGKITAAFDYFGTEKIASAAGVITPGMRFLVVLVYDKVAGTATIYVNGVSVATGAVGGITGAVAGIGFSVWSRRALTNAAGTGAVPSTTLNASMTSSQTTVPIAAVPAGLPASGYFVCEHEEMSFTYDLSGNVSGITVVRGVNGTFANSHASAKTIATAERCGAVARVSGSAWAANHVMPQSVTKTLTREAGFGDGDGNKLPLPQPARKLSPDGWASRPLPDDAPLASDSATMVTEFVRQVGLSAPWVNYNQYTPRVWTATNDDPVAVITQTHTPQDSRMQQHWVGVHMPTDAVPAAGTDSEMYVINTDTGEFWEFWAMSWNVRDHSGGDGLGEANWGGYWPEGRTFEGHFSGSYSAWGTTACSIGLMAGLMGIDEMIAGAIHHQLAVAIPQPHSSSPAPYYHWPAQRSDGFSATGIREGSVFRLPPGYCATHTFPYRATRILAEAAERYGIHIRDVSGNVTFYAEQPTPGRQALLPGGVEPWNNNAGLKLLDGGPGGTAGAFPWSALVRLDEGWVQNQFGTFTRNLRRTGLGPLRRVPLLGYPSPLFAQSQASLARIIRNEGTQRVRYSNNATQLASTPSKCPWIEPGGYKVLQGWAGAVYGCTDDGLAGLVTVGNVLGS
jgi:hypothetical protein